MIHSAMNIWHFHMISVALVFGALKKVSPQRQWSIILDYVSYDGSLCIANAVPLTWQRLKVSAV